ncbi:hypothetical protein CDA63_11325 [Hymenobacter amundsenii]|uniref:Alpha/beta hydrolase n=1 Tax=Hymenobacter amundsenii TaxID=2006685 RepID=A0A246FK99_9BACT|nr:hypothetical protein [Hymenobacter amundsenii]OWP62969.1 hypothetical protein CDA63_11325 [Hymenobacter amundsenii]
MKRFAPTRFLATLLLAASLAPATAAPALVAPLTIAVTPDNPAAHPNFTVRVVGGGQPMLLIPGLTCHGAVWYETVTHY